MEYVNLDKLVWFQEGPGVRNYQYVDKGIKLINVTNLVNGKLKLHLTNRFISEEEANGKYKHFMCDIGDLVIASSGITYDTLDKKIAFVTEKDLPLCMNTSVIRFKPLDNNVCLDFIYYFLKSKKYKNQISKLMTGSAQLNYGPSHLHKVKIPLYSFDKQLKIAKELKKIDSTILICHNNLENLDNIVKSQFIEMFSADFPLKRIDKVCSLKSGTTFDKRYELTEGTMLYCKVSDMNLIGNEKYLTISKTYVDRNYGSKFAIPKNSVVFPKRGGAIGTNKKRITKDDTCVDLNTMGVTPSKALTIEYLYQYFQNIDLLSLCDGSIIPQLNNKNIGPLIIKVPPIVLQSEFASFVEQINKSKYFEGGIP